MFVVTELRDLTRERLNVIAAAVHATSWQAKAARAVAAVLDEIDAATRRLDEAELAAKAEK